MGLIPNFVTLLVQMGAEEFDRLAQVAAWQSPAPEQHSLTPYSTKATEVVERCLPRSSAFCRVDQAKDIGDPAA